MFNTRFPQWYPASEIPVDAHDRFMLENYPPEKPLSAACPHCGEAFVLEDGPCPTCERDDQEDAK